MKNGQTITLSASPSKYYDFENWDGDVTGSLNPITITVNSNKTVTAIFVKIDDDEDGVENNLDNCPDTQAGENVNPNGCSESQLVGDKLQLFDKFWYTDYEYAYQNAKKIIYSNGTTEGYLNDELFYTADWVWEDERLGIMKLYNVEGTYQPYPTLWQKYYDIKEHSFKEIQSSDQINYGPEVLWTDTDN
ncbi:InlB B-repeat-containing protein [Mangrovimonas xylaniphaga]|uniref:InlB B-repeat-containing protein n=1 Tax=Mangrovimonas xylaniphaga TaxID=1645915 RepID=UPI0006B643C0|nr:hypothetical protein [Mangrovimonas xylaniphaga]